MDSNAKHDNVVAGDRKSERETETTYNGIEISNGKGTE